MNQANVEKLVSRLRYKVTPNPRRLRTVDGPEGRLRKMQKTLTALLKYERIELNYPRADEARGYAERLISEALRYGPNHKETMELADFWIGEKQLVHKLFKVLIPRYENCTMSFTKLHRAPKIYPGDGYERSILELRGNPYPTVEQYNMHERNLLHNVLLDAARKDFQMEKYKELAEHMNLQRT